MSPLWLALQCSDASNGSQYLIGHPRRLATNWTIAPRSARSTCAPVVNLSLHEDNTQSTKIGFDNVEWMGFAALYWCTSCIKYAVSLLSSLWTVVVYSGSCVFTVSMRTRTAMFSSSCAAAHRLATWRTYASYCHEEDALCREANWGASMGRPTTEATPGDGEVNFVRWHSAGRRLSHGGTKSTIDKHLSPTVYCWSTLSPRCPIRIPVWHTKAVAVHPWAALGNIVVTRTCSAFTSAEKNRVDRPTNASNHVCPSIVGTCRPMLQ